MSGKRHGKKALLVAFEDQDDSVEEAKASACFCPEHAHAYLDVF